MIVISIDFAKAYDSVDRKTMIENLRDYKVHENSIYVIADTYTGVKITVEYGNENKTEINISSDIIQDCTGSTTYTI